MRWGKQKGRPAVNKSANLFRFGFSKKNFSVSSLHRSVFFWSADEYQQITGAIKEHEATELPWNFCLLAHILSHWRNRYKTMKTFLCSTFLPLVLCFSKHFKSPLFNLKRQKISELNTTQNLTNISAIKEGTAEDEPMKSLIEKKWENAVKSRAHHQSCRAGENQNKVLNYRCQLPP